MDTDRDRDIAFLEVQEENRELVEGVMREKRGKRARRMADGSNETQGVEGGNAGGQAPAQLGGLPPVGEPAGQEANGIPSFG